MSSVINFRQRRRPSRRHVPSEGQIGRRWRLRHAIQKIHPPKEPVQPAQPHDPSVVTFHDYATIDHARAITNSIAARDIQTASAIKAGTAATRGDLAAAEDELKHLHQERDKHATSREEFEHTVKEAGLGHELAPHSPWPTRIVKIAATVFEAITLAVPMQLLGVVDFGHGVGHRQIIGAALAFLLGIAYALLLAMLAEGVGKQLKHAHFRHVTQAEDTRDQEAEGWPKPIRAVVEGRVIAAAIIALAFALFAASLIREAAIKILAASGESHVAVGWPLFFMITVAVFAAVAAVAHWRSAPLADEHARLNAPVVRLDKQIESKRRETYNLAAQVEAAHVQIEAIKASSHEEQIGQLRLAGEEVGHRRGANAHIHGVGAEPGYVQDVLADPEKHVRPVTVADDELTDRIDRIRSHVTSQPSKERATTDMPADVEDDEPQTVNDPDTHSDDTDRDERKAA